jgi:hypothetical protein
MDSEQDDVGAAALSVSQLTLSTSSAEYDEDKSNFESALAPRYQYYVVYQGWERGIFRNW